MKSSFNGLVLAGVAALSVVMGPLAHAAGEIQKDAEWYLDEYKTLKVVEFTPPTDSGKTCVVLFQLEGTGAPMDCFKRSGNKLPEPFIQGAKSDAKDSYKEIELLNESSVHRHFASIITFSPYTAPDMQCSAITGRAGEVYMGDNNHLRLYVDSLKCEPK